MFWCLKTVAIVLTNQFRSKVRWKLLWEFLHFQSYIEFFFIFVWILDHCKCSASCRVCLCRVSEFMCFVLGCQARCFDVACTSGGATLIICVFNHFFYIYLQLLPSSWSRSRTIRQISNDHRSDMLLVCWWCCYSLSHSDHMWVFFSASYTISKIRCCHFE